MSHEQAFLRMDITPKKAIAKKTLSFKRPSTKHGKLKVTAFLMLEFGDEQTAGVTGHPDDTTPGIFVAVTLYRDTDRIVEHEAYHVFNKIKEFGVEEEIATRTTHGIRLLLAQGAKSVAGKTDNYKGALRPRKQVELGQRRMVSEPVKQNKKPNSQTMKEVNSNG